MGARGAIPPKPPNKTTTTKPNALDSEVTFMDFNYDLRDATRLAGVAFLACALLTPRAPAEAQSTTVTLDKSVASSAATGRLFLFFAKSDTREPRLQACSYGGSVPFFGTDVSQ